MCQVECRIILATLHTPLRRLGWIDVFIVYVLIGIAHAVYTILGGPLLFNCFSATVQLHYSLPCPTALFIALFNCTVLCNCSTASFNCSYVSQSVRCARIHFATGGQKVAVAMPSFFPRRGGHGPFSQSDTICNARSTLRKVMESVL